MKVISEEETITSQPYNCFKNSIQHILKLNLKLTCKAIGLSIIISDASLKALDALISPSAAMILALASLSASASAAIARCSWTGSLTSFLKRFVIISQYSAA